MPLQHLPSQRFPTASLADRATAAVTAVAPFTLQDHADRAAQHTPYAIRYDGLDREHETETTASHKGGDDANGGGVTPRATIDAIDAIDHNALLHIHLYGGPYHGTDRHGKDLASTGNTDGTTRTNNPGAPADYYAVEGFASDFWYVGGVQAVGDGRVPAGKSGNNKGYFLSAQNSTQDSTQDSTKDGYNPGNPDNPTLPTGIRSKTKNRNIASSFRDDGHRPGGLSGSGGRDSFSDRDAQNKETNAGTSGDTNPIRNRLFIRDRLFTAAAPTAPTPGSIALLTLAGVTVATRRHREEGTGKKARGSRRGAGSKSGRATRPLQSKRTRHGGCTRAHNPKNGPFRVAGPRIGTYALGLTSDSSLADVDNRAEAV